MNLTQAIKSGKPFRRASWEYPDWLIIKKNSIGYGDGELTWEASGRRAILSYKADLTANDWEVKD